MSACPLTRLLMPILLTGLFACSGPDQQTVSTPSAAGPVDAQATEQTRKLLDNLHRLKQEYFLFGHQDSLAYGVEWMNEPGRSDVKDVTGDYPALYGWDIGHLELGDNANLDDVPFNKMKDWIRAAYRRGGVITLSWHMTHPVTGAPSWETEPGAGSLLPGRANHANLKAHLDRFAEFAAELTVDTDGSTVAIPVIFRPWHEHNGDWFWWGKRHTSEEDYIALWRFTVGYLRDEKGLHNLLYAWSPDRSRIDMNQFRDSYLYAYPGDDYVDVLGLDNYWDLGHPGNEAPREENQAQFVQSLTGLAEIATEKGKLAAMTEGGQDTLPEADFWTNRLLAGLLANDRTRRIGYVQVWRNANRAKENRDHFYVPFPGHPSQESFTTFYRHPASLFESDLPPMYE